MNYYKVTRGGYMKKSMKQAKKNPKIRTLQHGKISSEKLTFSNFKIKKKLSTTLTFQLNFQ